jgi:formylglycine-generating enzyme required for sulfatase activity
MSGRGQKFNRILFATVFGWLPASTATAVTIATVPVGNPGNAGDTRYPNGGVSSFGSVSYSYNIGTYEVTAGQYTEFLNAVAKTDTYGLYHPNMDTAVGSVGCNIKRSGSSGNYTYSVAADWANRPVNYVTYWDSCRFANWLHNGQPTGAQGAGTTETGAYTLTTTGIANNTVTRDANATWAITSENEWYKAAYYDPNKPGGAGYWNYPTRSNTKPSNVLSSTGTNNANYHDSQSNINGGTGYTILDPYWRTEVGAFASSPSAYGTFDQAGNVWEWDEVMLLGSSRGIRGGSYNFGESSLLASHRTTENPFQEGENAGFRVVQLPEPTTALSLLAVLPFLRRRRERIAP